MLDATTRPPPNTLARRSDFLYSTTSLKPSRHTRRKILTHGRPSPHPSSSVSTFLKLFGSSVSTSWTCLGASAVRIPCRICSFTLMPPSPKPRPSGAMHSILTSCGVVSGLFISSFLRVFIRTFCDIAISLSLYSYLFASPSAKWLSLLCDTMPAAIQTGFSTFHEVQAAQCQSCSRLLPWLLRDRTHRVRLCCVFLVRLRTSLL